MKHKRTQYIYKQSKRVSMESKRGSKGDPKVRVALVLPIPTLASHHQPPETISAAAANINAGLGRLSDSNAR